MRTRPGLHRTAAVLLLLVLAAVAFGSQTGGVVRISAGPALAASQALSGVPEEGVNPDATAPLITTVHAEPLSKRQTLWCWVRKNCDTLLLPKQTGPSAPGAQMATSIRDARAAAVALTGPDVPFPTAPGPNLSIDGIGGPSAGLTLTLHFINLRSTGNLFAAYTVAATGTVDSGGNVGAVGGVAYKVHGAQKAGAEVFFVPAAEATQVPGDVDITVVPVETVADAVGWLCSRGATSSAC